MAKQTGLGFTITVQDAGGVARNIANDINSIDFGTPRGTQEITGLDKSAAERLLLTVDGHVTIKGTVNTSLNMSHDVFKTVPSTSVIRSVVIGMPGGGSLTLNCLFSDYQIVRAADGSLTFTAIGALADGAVPTWV